MKIVGISFTKPIYAHVLNDKYQRSISSDTSVNE